jgi:RNA polymerase sigma factor (sigma-70 family)
LADDEVERFEALYRQHFRGVLGYALARLEPERAKDAVAETFLVAWRRLSDVPPDPAAWLFGVARKVIAEQLRADSRRDALADRLASPGWQLRPAGPADPADQVVQREAALTALAQLTERDRETLTLLAWHGLSTGQAADVLGVSSLGFAVRLHRARRRLATALAAADGAAGGSSAAAGSSAAGGSIAAGGSRPAGPGTRANSVTAAVPRTARAPLPAPAGAPLPAPAGLPDRHLEPEPLALRPLPDSSQAAGRNADARANRA